MNVVLHEIDEKMAVSTANFGLLRSTNPIPIRICTGKKWQRLNGLRKSKNRF